MVSTDLDGNTRIAHGTLDIGPYESLVARIPTVSGWGLMAMTLFLLTAGTIVLIRRRDGTMRIRSECVTAGCV